MRTASATAFTLLALSTAAAPAAAKQTGHLDPSFGKNGKLVLSARQLGGPANGENMPPKLLPRGKGRFLLAYDNRLLGFEKSGAPDRSFGAAGVVTLKPPAGETLHPTDVTIDPAGRILISGTASTVGAPHGTGVIGEQAPPPSRAAVVRLLPNGAPDPDFGSNGLVETTFGFPTPPVEGASGSYPGPSAEALSIAADASGDPIVTGSRATSLATCYPFTPILVPQAYVARLGLSGNVETVDTDPPVGSVHRGASLTAAGEERILFQGDQSQLCPRGESLNQPSNLALLDSAGNADPSFSPATLSYANVPRIALDTRGRPIVSGRRQVGESESPIRTAVTRLRANGTLDSSFGQDGATILPERTQPHVNFADTIRPVAIDASNRPIIGGGLVSSPSFSLTRLTARGALDARFGSNGVATVGFSAATDAQVDTLIVTGAGPIVAAGPLKLRKSPKAPAVAIVRYVPGS